MIWLNFINKLCLLPKLFSELYSCFMLRHLMTSWNLKNIEFKIWFSQKRKELLKIKNIFPSLTSALVQTKKTSKNVSDTTFKQFFEKFACQNFRKSKLQNKFNKSGTSVNLLWKAKKTMTTMKSKGINVQMF